MNTLSLKSEIEQIIDSNYRNDSMVDFANILEYEWIKNNVVKTSIYYGHYEIYRYFEKENYRIVRQCGDKQVGKNTLLTSLYKGSSLIGTLKIYFDMDDNKLEIEASC